MMNLPARNLHHAKILRSAEREYQLMIYLKKKVHRWQQANKMRVFHGNVENCFWNTIKQRL